MASALLVLFLIAPLLMGLTFALKFRHRFRKPVWACVFMLVEGYVLALLVSMVFGASTLLRVGLSGVPSPSDGSLLEKLSTTVVLALVTFVVLNGALLWWHVRALPKRA